MYKNEILTFKTHFITMKFKDILLLKISNTYSTLILGQLNPLFKLKVNLKILFRTKKNISIEIFRQWNDRLVKNKSINKPMESKPKYKQ